MIINSKYSSLFIIMSKIFLDNFITIFLNKSLILGNFDKEKYSEILWTKTGKEVFSFNNPNICIMYTNESLTLVEYGKNTKKFQISILISAVLCSALMLY